MKRPIIQISHLKYEYPNSDTPTIKDLNLRIYEGQWVSLIGLNGSGKSTLVKLIDGLLPKTKGQIVINQIPLISRNLQRIRSQIGIVFQNPQDQFVGATVKDEIAFGLENRQVPPTKINALIKWALAVVGMEGYQDTLIDNLSGGQQQRIAIADVMVVKPKILILDEATSMLNPQSRINVIRLIQRLKRKLHLTVVDITHDIDETRFSQKIIVMDQGRIVLDGAPDQVFSQEKTLRALHLGIPDVDRLRDSLIKRGVPVPKRHFTETEMLSWLHKLFLNT